MISYTRQGIRFMSGICFMTKQRVRFVTGPGFCVSWYNGYDLFRALGSVSCGLLHETAGGI